MNKRKHSSGRIVSLPDWTTGYWTTTAYKLTCDATSLAMSVGNARKNCRMLDPRKIAN